MFVGILGGYLASVYGGLVSSDFIVGLQDAFIPWRSICIYKETMIFWYHAGNYSSYCSYTNTKVAH
jgi:phospholipid/cholesterol/gamma-HCH transport system permease protein